MSGADGAELAELIAQRGREVVLERLRAAFGHQSTVHQAVDLDAAQLERFVQDAAARAGGALWRRSLAEALMRELEIDLAQALEHPALERAGKLAHAPVYAPAPAPAPAPESERVAPKPPRAKARPAAPRPKAVARKAAPAAPKAAPVRAKPEPVAARPKPAAPKAEAGALLSAGTDPDALRLGAVHLNGIETLRQGDRDIELRLSDAGLDVLKRSTGAAIGRLEWGEIETAEVPAVRRGLRGRRRARELHVSTARGQAQFELPGVTDEELQEHLQPTLARLTGKSVAGNDGGGSGG